MSRQLINEYRADLDRLRQVSGSRRESVLREAFKDLLKRWGRSQDLQFIPEHDIVTSQKNRIYVDGALLHALRVPFGYWEAKDEDDDLDAEILAKRRKGYPTDNIIFSDDHTAVLIQDGGEVARVAMGDTDALYDLLTRFFAHERQEVADFNKAVKQFAADLPEILKALRERIAEKRAASRDFAAAERAFLKHAREAINPAVSEDDVQEMLIQHILTEDIFAKVFDNPDFHEQNNVAAELKKLEDALFGRGEKSTLLRALAPYYSGIASTAALISSHSEKQGFLKALYEDFYKAYNRKAADRLGVVYTPGEIVRFMIRSADWLCEQHFGKNLIDRGVEILDPATGTGTFIVELLEHFRGHHDKLRHKYKEELHANEVAILPYYVANLNIEATYQAITGQFAEYANLCLVDTLDNVDALGIHAGHQFDLLGSLSDENIERIKRQNRRKISVIIGNPPYNANQQNENDNNKNRAYAHIDKRIKDTYIKASTAQKTKLYDMYVRFLRWASDRLGDDGVIAFITNRSFIDAHMADGLRRTLAQDFSEGWIVDLGGDYKKTGVGGSGNVFGIGTGVAISFWIKRKATRGATTLRYLAAPTGNGEDKLGWLERTSLEDCVWTLLDQREDAGWIDLPIEDTDSLLPIGNTATKGGARKDSAIFKLYSLGISTNRDEWLYDRSEAGAVAKAKQLSDTYAAIPTRTELYPDSIKWSRNLKRRLLQGRREPFDPGRVTLAAYRPYTERYLYQSSLFVDEAGLAGTLFPEGASNEAVCFSDPTSQKPFLVKAVGGLVDLHFVGAGAGTIYVPRYRYTKSGERIDNITDWAVRQFKDRYVKNAGGGGKLRAKLPRTRSSITSTPCSTIRCTARPMR
ncbi:MAG TPA: type ISP restriction/modification enzyme [Sphingomonas sp.]|nr:type ISP restriction/modification enzyme [Sphingomonas sp.]